MCAALDSLIIHADSTCLIPLGDFVASLTTLVIQEGQDTSHSQVVMVLACLCIDSPRTFRLGEIEHLPVGLGLLRDSSRAWCRGQGHRLRYLQLCPGPQM